MYKKLWQNRFHKRKEYSFVEDFNASIGVDKRLAEEEITSSLAYARALHRANILNKKELRNLTETLQWLKMNLRKKQLKLNKAEDIHTAIEWVLTKRLGETGQKIHTGRSRNEQVVLDERLYLKKGIKEIIKELSQLQKVILIQAKRHLSVIMPGYTHLQQAQPIRFSHYLMALFFMLERDKQRLFDLLKRVDICPLGSAALAGTTYQINRKQVAKELGFRSISQNALDATSDRDFIIEFLSASAILMMHLTRFCEDLIIWSSREFGAITLSDAVTTSSSLMPQKKNPDSLELIRGKSGRVFGHLFGLLTVLKGLPMGYNKDLQEDKIPLFDTLDTVTSCLKVFRLVLQTMSVKPERLKAMIDDNTLATDLVDYLVQKGIPFRESHRLVAEIVRYALKHRRLLKELTLAELRQFTPKIQDDVYQILDLYKSIDAHNQPGGTSEKMVQAQIKIGWQYLKRKDKTYER